MKLFRKPTISLGAFLGTLSGLTLINGQAHADLVFTLNNSAGTLYNYTLNFSNSLDAGTGTPSQRLQAGNFATLYDVASLNSATLNPAFSSLFTLTTQPVGITPGMVIPPDDPTFTNVTLTYNGPTLTADQSYLNILQVDSSFGSLNPNGSYASEVTKNTGAATGTNIDSIGTVSIPAPQLGPRLGPTPEPGSLALFVGAGLSGSVFAFRRRRRRK